MGCRYAKTRLRGACLSFIAAIGCGRPPELPDGPDTGAAEERYRDAVDTWELVCEGVLPGEDSPLSFAHTLSRIVGGSLISETRVYRNKDGRRADAGYGIAKGSSLAVRVPPATYNFSVEEPDAGWGEGEILSVRRGASAAPSREVVGGGLGSAGLPAQDQGAEEAALYPCARVEDDGTD